MANAQQTRHSRLSPADWQRIFADWKASGLSQQAYCKAKTISLHTFGYWRSKLNVTKKPAPFQSVKVAAPTPATESPPRAPIHLRLPNGITVIIPPAADQVLLKSLLNLLGATSC
jgi:transposase-like protein